tara:strand:- start:2043 stop:2219 length:177 start_codon:yes stop_codon:yes gene_type:complete
MPAGKKKETKDTKTKSVVSNESSIMTRLEVVEKMLLITRDEFKKVTSIVERMKERMGL